MTDYCRICGEEMEIDESGIANHLDENGNVDYDADGEHVPLLDEE